MATTAITWITNGDGTATLHWTDDANPNLEDYLVTVDGVTTKYPVSVDSLVLSATPHVVSVMPELSPEASATSVYTPPPPTLKPLLVGPLFRGAVVTSLLPSFGGWDVYGPEQGAIGMDQLFPTGPTLVANNPIDVAGTAVQKVAGRSDLGLLVRPEFGFHTPAWMLKAGGDPVQITDPTTGKVGLVPRFWDPRFIALAKELYAIIAGRYDAVEWFRQFVFATGTTAYAEADIRQMTVAANVTALLNAGYTVALDLACREADYDYLPTVFRHTWLAQAFNAYQSILSKPVVSTAETSQLVADFVRKVGKQALVGNNSVRSTANQYPVLYGSDFPKAIAAGAHISVQLAASANVGNEYQAALTAAKYGAVSMEMTGAVGANITPSQAAAIRVACLANAA